MSAPNRNSGFRCRLKLIGVLRATPHVRLGLKAVNTHAVTDEP
jgi:hypothetical protein